MGSVSSIPHSTVGVDVSGERVRGGEAEPIGLAVVRDPVLRAALMAAHRGWARRYAPWLLQEWLA